MGARCRIDFAVAEEEAAHRLSCSSEVGLPPRRRLRRLESSRKGQARIGLSSVDFRVGLTSGNIVLRVGGIGDGEADLQGTVFGAVNDRVERIRIRRNAGSLVQGNSCFHGGFVITGGGIPLALAGAKLEGTAGRKLGVRTDFAGHLAREAGFDVRAFGNVVRIADGLSVSDLIAPP